MFCSKCGTKNPDGTKFCSKCGEGFGVPAQPSEGGAKPEAESSTGMSANIAGLLCYLFTWITGIVFVIIEKKSTFVKFHAWQSIMTFGVLTVALIILSLIPFVGWILYIPVQILMVILWIILMIQAGTGKMWKVPGAGNWAEKMANR
jgi:uncharacterized membrane protein